MGGAIALTMILAKSGVARGLVLVGSGARLRIRQTLIDAARERAAAAPSHRFAERQISLDEVLSPDATLEARAWLREHIGRSTAPAAYADFVATNAFDVMNQLEAVDVPTLVVGGEDDRWTPPKFQRYLTENIPNARLVMFDGCGHYPFVEKADAFNTELERFLGDLVEGSA
jgi:pimeloyl-ACP methyl ester carboxylesterase